eukprot:179460-Chlamydomonas_euryale.AAC.6
MVKKEHSGANVFTCHALVMMVQKCGNAPSTRAQMHWGWYHQRSAANQNGDGEGACIHAKRHPYRAFLPARLCLPTLFDLHIYLSRPVRFLACLHDMLVALNTSDNCNSTTAAPQHKPTLVAPLAGPRGHLLRRRSARVVDRGQHVCLEPAAPVAWLAVLAHQHRVAAPR